MSPPSLKLKEKMMKLTKNQIAALLRVEDDRVSLTRRFRIQGETPTVIARLLKMGLIEWRETAITPRAFLTPKGELTLKDNISLRDKNNVEGPLKKSNNGKSEQ